MFFIPGQVVSTMTPTNSILARAKIKETIPQQFAINDLSKLLNVLRLFKQPDLEIEKEREGDVLVIREGERIAKLTLSPLELIAQPSNKDPTFSRDISFALKSGTVQELKEAASSFGHTALVFHTDGSKIFAETTNIANPTADRFRVVVGDTNMKFRIAIKMSNFLVMNMNYNVEISFLKQKNKPSAVLHMLGEDVEYYIAVEAREMENPYATR